MIFAMASTEPTLMIFISESDVANKLRPGNTLFVDEKHLGGRLFKKLVISLSKSDNATIDLLRATDPRGTGVPLVDRQPEEGMAICKGCEGEMPLQQLFEGQCIVCWSKEAKKARLANN